MNFVKILPKTYTLKQAPPTYGIRLNFYNFLQGKMYSKLV